MTFDQLLPALSAAVGAILGPPIKAAYDKYFSKRKRADDAREARKVALVDESQAFRDLACEYWNSSCLELGKNEELLVARLIGLQHELSILASELYMNSSGEKTMSDRKLSELLSSTTGGAFGEPERSREADRLRKIHVAETHFRNFVTRPNT